MNIINHFMLFMNKIDYYAMKKIKLLYYISSKDTLNMFVIVLALNKTQ